MTDREFITVAELRQPMSQLKDDDKLSFAGGLSFYHFKRWGEDEFIVEFNEAQGDLDAGFRKRNPNVKVVFIDTAKADWDESGVVGSIDVTVR
jgi:hypothetical protein